MVANTLNFAMVAAAAWFGYGVPVREMLALVRHRAAVGVRDRRCSPPASPSPTATSAWPPSASPRSCCFIFLYILRTSVQAEERGEELEQRTRELASLQVGLLSTVLQTLSMRDAMTARHSAAVARYSREVAAMLGLDEREQDLIHTAGLLHDIGKFILPGLRPVRRTASSPTRSGSRSSCTPSRAPSWSSASRATARSPRSSCTTTSASPAAATRPGIAGEEIPIGARIISVADTYDVMTSRDSYRRPVSSEAALAELRRVAGHPARPAGRRGLRAHDPGEGRGVQPHRRGRLRGRAGLREARRRVRRPRLGA